MGRKEKAQFEHSEYINAIREGNSEAFKKLFLNYYERLCRFTYRYVKSRIIAEDLVQEVFVKIWERREQLKADKNIKAYLYRAVRNEALDFIEHQDMVNKKLSLLKISLDKELPDENYDKLDQDKFISHVQAIIEKLPDKTRQIYKLNRTDGLSYKEIAHILDLSVKAVEYHISKAFQIIRSSLQKNMNSLYR